ncbi:hypothetical protein E7744_02780 [Citricoccus sp. SGAir0253]|uniref:hypothetical protein n=1 Tax=Citricoccus sp. SGAir0253 TaxID=2567881 RepID=UPI0010CCC427|nr:hypothetical protein [Citricoccus sp. SGAir0253]QCU77261.1 hypothetical protein E7744_02780 [Citricoccus sp. SGAir0253]
MIPAHATTLARLGTGDPDDGRPFRVRLDSGLNLETPSAKRLAEVYALPYLTGDRELYREGSAILARAKGSTAAPTPVPLAGLADEIRASLASLPEVRPTEAGDRYHDARLLVLHGDAGTVGAYVEAVVRAVRVRLPTYRPPRPAAERGPALTPSEYVKRSRDKAARIEADSIRAWLAEWREYDDAPAPGDAVNAADLFARAVDEINDNRDFGDKTPQGDEYRVPRRRVFYAVADEILGPRRRVGKARTAVYTMPARPAEETA